VRLSGTVNVSFYDQQAGYALVGPVDVPARAQPQCFTFPEKLIFFLLGSLQAEYLGKQFDLPAISTFFIISCNQSGPDKKAQLALQTNRLGPERRQVMKAAFRALVEAARPDLSPEEVDAVVAQVNQRMTMGSMQCCLASDPPPAPAQDPPPPPAQAQPPPPAQGQPPAQAPPGPVQRPQTPPWGRWLDRDTNPCLNLRIWESKQRPLELCRWEGLEALPPIGQGYHQRYKLVNDRLPKVRQRLHRAAEYRRGIDGRARNNA
ncbi:hypothetical protein QJQ45_018188, partial [Haematococcus lacustris]